MINTKGGNRLRMKIGINGFGRIGRQIFRLITSKDSQEIIAINDPNLSIDQMRLLIQYDSVYGKFSERIDSENNHIIINDKNRRIEVFSKSNLIDTEWGGIDVLIDSSGNYPQYDEYVRLIDMHRNISHVIITGYYGAADQTIVFGVNENEFRRSSKVISTSTCDGVAISPILFILSNLFKINYVSIASLHPYLSNQKLLDGANLGDSYPSLTRWRAATDSLIPKGTSISDRCMDLVPTLKDKIDAYQLRVPTSCVSCAFLYIDFEEKIDEERLKRWLNNLESPVFYVNEDALVSKDFMGTGYSSIIDLRRFKLSNKRLEMLVWYDNESGYASRVVDMVRLIKNKRGH